MEKFNLLMFIDDDYATNCYHEIIAEDSNVANNMRFFQSANNALDFLQTDAQNPEVIFLDVNMPEVNGWEFMEKFGGLNMVNRPKVIMLSTSVNPADKMKSEENQLISEFINKPLTEEYLKNLLHETSKVAV